MNDIEFLRSFESCELPKESFHHRDHIRLAWLYLGMHTLAEAERRVEESIRRFATHLGVPEKYHQTITIAWMRRVASAKRRLPAGATFNELLCAVPDLL